jgi:hypothetical protein
MQYILLLGDVVLSAATGCKCQGIKGNYILLILLPNRIQNR